MERPSSAMGEISIHMGDIELPSRADSRMETFALGDAISHGHLAYTEEPQSSLSSRRGSSPSKWLSLGAKHQCIHLENITPSSLAIAEMTNISLQISALPELPPCANLLVLLGSQLPTVALYNL